VGQAFKKDSEASLAFGPIIPSLVLVASMHSVQKDFYFCVHVSFRTLSIHPVLLRLDPFRPTLHVKSVIRQLSAMQTRYSVHCIFHSSRLSCATSLTGSQGDGISVGDRKPRRKNTNAGTTEAQNPTMFVTSPSPNAVPTTSLEPAASN
jgi:hypothetical protein